MSSKRKLDREEDDAAKRQRRRLRSNSEPQPRDADQTEKRAALRRLFGRISSADDDNRDQERDNVDVDHSSDDCDSYTDENEDPLLDSIPVDMDPEQLGFLVCAQETLRFLHMRGMSIQHPMFARLRSRFLRGISEMGLA